MILRPRPYDIVDPDHDDGVPLIGQVIPYDLFKAKVSEAFHYVAMIIEVGRDMTQAPIGHFPSPPPVRSGGWRSA